MLKLALNSFNLRIGSCLLLKVPRSSFHVSQTTVNTQDYDISEEVFDYQSRVDGSKPKRNNSKTYHKATVKRVTFELIKALECSESEEDVDEQKSNCLNFNPKVN
jgi:hypothetical protein